MSELPIEVSIDDRVRLAMAVLAATDWPEREQAQETHAVHQHSKQTRQFVREHRNHAAVAGLNSALADGAMLTDVFSAVLRHSWPNFRPVEPLPDRLRDSTWVNAMADFYRVTAIADFWQEHAAHWEEAKEDLVAVFAESRLVTFLNQLRQRPAARAIAVVPSIVYPMLAPVLATTASRLCLILPPAKAWGESPPWPFGEDPAWVVAQTCWHLTAHFMASDLPGLTPTNQALLRHAAVVLCLEQEFDDAEAMAYLVRSKKEQHLPQLPGVTESLRSYLANPESRTLVSLLG